MNARRTPFGDLNNKEWELVKMAVREFTDYVSSGDIEEYEKARDLFANPEKYSSRRHRTGKDQEKAEREAERKKI